MAGDRLEEVTARRLEAIGTGDGYVNAARAMARLNEEPLTQVLPDIACPVHVIGGEADVFCPRKAAEIMIAALRHGTYHEVARAGHLMSVDQPEAYAQAIRNALESSA